MKKKSLLALFVSVMFVFGGCDNVGDQGLFGGVAEFDMQSGVDIEGGVKSHSFYVCLSCGKPSEDCRCDFNDDWAREPEQFPVGCDLVPKEIKLEITSRVFASRDIVSYDPVLISVDLNECIKCTEDGKPLANQLPMRDLSESYSSNKYSYAFENSGFDYVDPENCVAYTFHEGFLYFHVFPRSPFFDGNSTSHRSSIVKYYRDKKARVINNKNGAYIGYYQIYRLEIGIFSK